MSNPTPATAPGPTVRVDIRDIKPPVEIPSGYEWLWWVLAALAIVIVAWLLWRWLRKRKAQAAFVPVVPAHVRARQKLQAALTLITQPKPFCIAVSDAARAYLEERFNFRAPERTTEEFLRELSATDLLAKPQKESLGRFLESCDLVKFAKYEPGEPELRELYSSATRLVDETVPTEHPSDVQESSTHLITTDIKVKSDKGRTLALIGAGLQLGPCIWVVAYVVMLFRMFNLATNPHPINLSRPLDAILAPMAEISSMAGGVLIALIAGMVIGLIGLILLIIALTSSRYRAQWFFWFLMIYGVILLGGFPCIGTVIGIFFIVYCLTKRREFLNRP